MVFSEKLMRVFSEGYEWYYCGMESESKKDLRTCASMTFAKWYYAALVQDTILTPANIIGSKCPSKDIEPAYILHMKSGGRGLGKYEYRYVSYSVNNHPLIQDIQILVSYCQPNCTVDAKGMLCAKDIAQIQNKLTIQHEYYVEYVMRLCYQLHLLTEAPAIHTHKVQVGEAYTKFLDLGEKEKFKRVVQSACIIAAERLTYSLDLDSGMIDGAFFEYYLQDNQSADKLFTDFYKLVDVDLPEIWKKESDELTEEEDMILTSFLFFGMMIDKWFFTPMSVFLRVIRPIFFTSFSFFHTINNMTTLSLTRQPVIHELFSPPTYYSLTPLGKVFSNKNKFSQNMQKMPKMKNESQLMEWIELEKYRHDYDYTMYVQELGIQKILRMKIFLSEYGEFWKEIDVPDVFPLDMFCQDVLSAFDVAEEEYILSVPKENGAVLCYATRASKRAINTTDDKIVMQLQPNIGDTWTIQELSSKMEVTIEIQSFELCEKGRTYPRIHKQSKKLYSKKQVLKYGDV